MQATLGEGGACSNSILLPVVWHVLAEQEKHQLVRVHKHAAVFSRLSHATHEQG